MVSAPRTGALLLVVLTSLGVAPAVAQVCSQAWTLEETLRIGSLDGDDALSGVLDLGVGPDGLLYVAQQYIPAITVFDAQGHPSHRVGRAGTGPGEIDGWPSALGWLGDTLWAADHAAVNFYGPDGHPGRQVYFRKMLPAEATLLQPGVPLADGSVLPRRIAVGMSVGDMEPYFTAASHPLRSVSEGGDTLRTIATVRNQMRAVIPDSRGTQSYIVHPLGGWRNPNFTVSPDGSFLLVIGDIRESGPNPSFDLLKISVSGDTLMRRSIAYEPREITRSEQAWLTEEFGNFRAGEYDSDSGSSIFPQRDAAARERARRAGVDAITFPETLPPVRQTVAGSDGSIWILRELDLPDLADRWQVYSAEGELEGEILIESGRAGPLPWDRRLAVLRADRDAVWGVTLGSFDEPYIHRYRVERPCQ